MLRNGLFAGLCVAMGWVAGRASHQNVNDLISVGWTVVDPEGYTVARFNEGLDLGYWTTVDKQK